jgi:hypothetical protein
MPDYQKGKIYTLRCYTDKSLIYVGSTTKSLCDRKSNHKFNSIKIPKNSFYTIVLNNGGWDNWYIELVENYPCSSKQELERREGEIMREIGNLNSKIPRGLTQKENLCYHTEYLGERSKEPEYIEKKKQNKKEYDKEYKEKTRSELKNEKQQYYSSVNVVVRLKKKEEQSISGLINIMN